MMVVVVVVPPLSELGLPPAPPVPSPGSAAPAAAPPEFELAPPLSKPDVLVPYESPETVVAPPVPPSLPVPAHETPPVAFAPEGFRFPQPWPSRGTTRRTIAGNTLEAENGVTRVSSQCLLREVPLQSVSHLQDVDRTGSAAKVGEPGPLRDKTVAIRYCDHEPGLFAPVSSFIHSVRSLTRTSGHAPLLRILRVDRQGRVRPGSHRRQGPRADVRVADFTERFDRRATIRMARIAR